MGLMTPAAKIEVNGSDITTKIGSRIIAIETRDVAGSESDSVSILLDDSDNGIPLPKKGARLAVWLGYAGELQQVGEYTIDETTITGPPDRLRMIGRGAAFGGDMKSPRVRSWHETTIGQIVETIAAEHGLSAVVAAEYKTAPLQHADQTNESDLNFCVRLARDNNAVCKPVGSSLVFTSRGRGRTVSGAKIPPVEISRGRMLSWSATLPDRAVYRQVVATYADVTGGQLVETGAGTGEPVFRIREPFPDETQAQSAAASTLARLQRTERVLSVTLPGCTAIAAEGPVRVSGVRSGVDGEWIAESVAHIFDTSGFITEVDLVPPAPEPSKAPD